jgi:hypothetical protein
MTATLSLAALGACLALASCATTSSMPPEPARPAALQEVRLATDPPGASCSLVHDGVVVATVTPTPGTISVRRDVCAGFNAPEKCRTFEIVCNRENYIEYRESFSVFSWQRLQEELGTVKKPSSAETALDVAVAIPLAVVLGSPVVAPFYLVWHMANKKNSPETYYAYPPLPEFALVPATFATDTECDAYFAARMSSLEMKVAARRERIDRECRYFPCSASDPEPCPHPACQKLRNEVDAYSKTQRDSLSAARARVRIVAP